MKVVGLALVASTFVALATQLNAEEDFPFVGTYTENEVCNNDVTVAGTVRSRVKITTHDIDSAFGRCAIVSKNRKELTFTVQVECEGPGGSKILGEINFTQRDDRTVDFWDQDQTYKATLHKCSE
jgi:hypothetical protein